MKSEPKPLVWIYGEIRTPPFSTDARIEAGFLMRQLQFGIKLSLPHSRPMPSIGPRCHELRIQDRNKTWRIVYRIDANAVLILDIFEKKSARTLKTHIDNCKRRMNEYDLMER